MTLKFFFNIVLGHFFEIRMIKFDSNHVGRAVDIVTRDP